MTGNLYVENTMSSVKIYFKEIDTGPKYCIATPYSTLSHNKCTHNIILANRDLKFKIKSFFLYVHDMLLFKNRFYINRCKNKRNCTKKTRICTNRETSERTQ